MLTGQCLPKMFIPCLIRLRKGTAWGLCVPCLQMQRSGSDRPNTEAPSTYFMHQHVVQDALASTGILDTHNSAAQSFHFHLYAMG